MRSPSPTVLFFHGLNTYGDDLLHLGPVNLGRMDRYLVPEFEKHGVRFISIDGVGNGSPEVQAEHALKVIQKIFDNSASEIRGAPEIQDGPLHLLGNSLGGLVARVVATQLNVKTVCSWGSPHLGAGAADLALKFPDKFPRMTKALKNMGYIVGKNRDVYRHYSSEGLHEFNLRYPIQGSTPEHSFVCAVPLRDVSPYFWPFYGPLHGLGAAEFAKRLTGKSNDIPDSDGFITAASQARGQVHGPYHLDHFVQAGFLSMLPRSAQRLRAKNEFERLCADICRVMIESESV